MNLTSLLHFSFKVKTVQYLYIKKIKKLRYEVLKKHHQLYIALLDIFLLISNNLSVYIYI